MTLPVWLIVILCILSTPMTLLLIAVTIYVIWWLIAMISELIYYVFARGKENE